MSIHTIFDCPYVEARGFNTKIPATLTFLIKNGPSVIIPEDRLVELANTKLYATTPLSKMFQDICSSGKLNNFVFLDCSRYQEGIPDLLTYEELVIDGRVIPNLPVPAQLQKCWINLTPILSAKDSYNGHLNLTDTSAAAAMVVRAALVSTYHDTNEYWLNPRLACYVIESYAHVVGHICRQIYNLNIEEELFVKTIFALYMAQVLGRSETDLKMPALLYRCTFLGSANDIMSRVEAINQYRENGGNSLLPPRKCCEVIAKAGPPRMHMFSHVNFYRAMSSSSIDSMTMLVAVDYAPFWVYQLLRNVSGYKNPLISTVMRMNARMKTIMTDFAAELESSGTILNQLNRR